MGNNRQVRWVMASYPTEFQPRRIQSLGSAGGFSGAQFWKVDAQPGPLCLRRWPRQHPSSDRLKFIHAVLRHVWNCGFNKIPVPFPTRNFKTYVREQGFLWELTPWLPGQADYSVRRSTPKLRAALAALAQFHVAASSFPGQLGGTAISPGILQRIARIEGYEPQRLARLAQAIDPNRWSELAARAGEVLALFPLCVRRVQATLAQAARLQVVLQPCIRDVWHGHLLYQLENVAAIVDFGAMHLENVAADIARLLGSMLNDDGSGWEEGLTAYQKIRPLSEAEAQLVRAYDQSGVLLSGLNWLIWVFEDDREFENKSGVLERLDHNLARLRQLASESN